MKPNIPDAARVWQRVLSPEPQEQWSLQALIRQLSMDIADLKQLSKAGDDRTVGMLTQELAGQIACLKGVLMLSGSNVPHIPEGTRSDHTLKQCYDHALQRLGAYRLRSSDPVYGPVFQELANQTQQHCRLIPELLGRLPNPKRPPARR